MSDRELKDLISTVTSMLELIKEQSLVNNPLVTNKALIETTIFINSIVLKNNGKQLLLFDCDS